MLSPLSEESIIARAARLHAGDALLGIGDDTAIVRPPASLQLLTTDLLVEGTHFTQATLSAQDLGWKALAVNLSDIAAMGGEPDFALLSLGLPPTLAPDWIEAFFQGFEDCAGAFGGRLVGGDTVRAERITVNVALTGHAEHPLRRRGAQPGDLIAVSGPTGASAAGLWLLLHPETNRREHAALIVGHQRPQPRLALGRALVGVAHALCDASDGLARSCQLLAEASQLTVILLAEQLPIPPGLPAVAELAGVEPMSWVVAGGEDYELVMAVPPDARPQIEQLGATVVGVCEAGDARLLLDSHGRRQPVPEAWGFRHF